MRATKYKHYGSEGNTAQKAVKITKSTERKAHKKLKALSFVIAISLAAAALIVPTTTLAPDVDAFEDSRAASYLVGDIDEFSLVIKDNCVPETTAPATEKITETVPATEATKVTKETKAVEETEATESTEESTEMVEIQSEVIEVSETETNEEAATFSESTGDYVYSGGYLLSISNPDPSYCPQSVSLSEYDRAKLERLVMGEAGSMGYTGCALVAQSIRDAMNRSKTTSIDAIISEYQYYAPTNKEPNQTVKDAVSYIFDQNGSAVQHRILCFYTGKSDWHETQQFIVGCGNVRFFDLW